MALLPDSIYSSYPEQQSICKNVAYSPITRTIVHDSMRGKVFCPFGAGNTMNQSIFADQAIMDIKYQNSTKWGMAPQLDPRPLTRIGIRYLTT
jgi:hypothetical protein